MSQIIKQKPKKFFKTSTKETIISNDKKKILSELIDVIIIERKKLKKVRINYISTQNSTSSQLYQIWTHFAIHFFKLKRIKSYSGGLTVSSINAEVVSILQSVGFCFKLLEFDHQNPIYEVSYKNMKKPLVIYSKLYDSLISNKPFIAVSLSKTIDEYCLYIPEVISKVYLPLNNLENTYKSNKSLKYYADLNQQIAAEVYFVFEQVQKLS
ncbi:hypothetical protein [Urechidicola vernalis]|uniref:Uncharacterized protein n=1 Tax=Urechidicola vernalis TaxID=3075600 RepID=A0ABU2Y3H1_9FLAO|nr:hypothetical protein [Urechidicola sp. P050]MDT0551800.1 hypothetical protein [Urechidicola sp. P050]